MLNVLTGLRSVRCTVRDCLPTTRVRASGFERGNVHVHVWEWGELEPRLSIESSGENCYLQQLVSSIEFTSVYYGLLYDCYIFINISAGKRLKPSPFPRAMFDCST